MRFQMFARTSSLTWRSAPWCARARQRCASGLTIAACVRGEVGVVRGSDAVAGGWYARSVEMRVE
jgi:hypothetical protein